MTAPNIVQTGASTLNRKWVYEFDLNYLISGTANWAALEGVASSTPNFDNPNMVTDTDQGGRGFQSSTKTGAGWSAAITVNRKSTVADPTIYHPVQEYLRLKSVGKFGPSNTVRVRIYEYDPNDPTGASAPRTEAYTGYCSVSWQESGGDQEGISTVAVALTGQGACTLIAHPVPKTAALIPVLAAAVPGSAGNGTIPAAGGAIVHITGTGFTGVSGASKVTFGGVNASTYTVDSDSLIVAVAPAKAAGTYPLIVTNATGASAGLTVTYV
jgi:hypothetical protein